MSNKNSDSLSHSRWNCKYHIVFAPKYRRQVIYQALKSDIGKILRTLLRSEESGNPRGGGVSCPHPYACQYSPELERIPIYGVFEGQKFADDF